VPVGSEPDVRAAGGVLWKPSRRHGIRVALVHRPSYDDWSLPKGKADGDETPAQTAHREVAEETGFCAAIGRRLTAVSYKVPAGLKTVQYFSAERRSGSFTANKEVDEIRWMPIDAAADLLTYDFDRAVLATFGVHPAALRTVVLVRHAKAGHRESFTGADVQRPLDPKGRKQARALVAMLSPFAPQRVVSAPNTRCRQTIEPLAKSLGLPIGSEPLLGEEIYRDDPAAARRRVVELATEVDDPGCVVVCSQGGVIPGVVKSLAARADLTVPDAGTPKAAFWVLTFDDGRLVQADAHTAPKICRARSAECGHAKARHRKGAGPSTFTSGVVHCGAATAPDVTSSWQRPSWPGPSWQRPSARP
jgi:8-oxo-dGTP diphosphatase